MGVMACHRAGCENILCDRYSPEYGYICEDCYQELLSQVISIGTFMATKKVPKDHDYALENHQNKVLIIFGPRREM